MSIDISDESINAEMQTFEDVSPFPDANLTGREIFFLTPLGKWKKGCLKT